MSSGQSAADSALPVIPAVYGGLSTRPNVGVVDGTGFISVYIDYNNLQINLALSNPNPQFNRPVLWLIAIKLMNSR